MPHSLHTISYMPQRTLLFRSKLNSSNPSHTLVLEEIRRRKSVPYAALWGLLRRRANLNLPRLASGSELIRIVWSTFILGSLPHAIETTINV